MKRTVQTIERPLIVSDRHPEIATTREDFAPAFAWADDECPVAWKIVRENKSRAFGRMATCYISAAGSDNPEDVAMRLSILHELVTGEGPFALERQRETLWNTNARFTIANYDGKSGALKGGLFQQHARWSDGKVYARNCTVLDYTTAKLDEVIVTFQRWYEARNERGELSGYANTTHITLDGKTVRTFPETP